MTTTAAVRTAITDSGGYPTEEQRRDALLELAVLVEAEQGRRGQPLTMVQALLVPTLASSLCTDVLVCFDELVHAVSQRSRFDGNPSGWLDENELSQGEFDRADEQTLAAVDEALDYLMAKRS